jgi:hypothetical protein
MLTPGEELGLGGLGLAGQVRETFYKIPEAELATLLRCIREEASRRHIVYLRDGKLETTPVLACPITVLPDQLAYLQAVSLTILNALKRLPELYLEDAQVREVLQLLPEEEAWFRDCWSPGHREHNPVFGRLDAMIDFVSPMWKDSLRYLEPNLSSIGGLHLVPTADQLLVDLVLPSLRAQDDRLQLSAGQDIRELLLQEIMDHLKGIGRSGKQICFLEPRNAPSGLDEQSALAEYFRSRYGLKVMHADPAELVLHHGEVYCHHELVDIAYRDYPVYDLLDLERQGVDIEPMRTLFRQNRIISSISAEIDQKSCWEILTDPQFTHKYFSADDRQVFRRHLLWTRLLSDRRTLLPAGYSGDLLNFTRRSQECLVLKPNRAFGGEGVVLGHLVSRAEWESALERALADSERWVVQQLASIPVHEFPVLGEDGKVHVEPFYAVMGFAPTKHGLAIVGRASQKQVVNVAQRGGMCVVLVGRPPGSLVGPGPLWQQR